MSDVFLLKEPIEDEKDFYESFLKGTLQENNYFSDIKVTVPDVEDFITYGGNKNKKNNNKEVFKNLVKIFINNFVDLTQEIYMSPNFWKSYLVSKLRMSIIRNHPQINESFNAFKLIVLREFNWENYLYKAAIYGNILVDRVADESLRDEYIDIIYDNSDTFNYILKKKAFRNDNFIFNMICLLYENKEYDLGGFLKKSFSYKDSRDIRVNRIILEEMNAAYPTILFPILDYEDFKSIFFQYINSNETVQDLFETYLSINKKTSEPNNKKINIFDFFNIFKQKNEK